MNSGGTEVNYFAWIRLIWNQETIPYQDWFDILVEPAQPAFTCSKLAIETVKQGVKYVQTLQ